MTGAIQDRSRLSFFGLGGGRRGPDAAAPSALDPERLALDGGVQILNLKAVVAAVLQGAGAGLIPSSPLLQMTGQASRPPVLADIASPWFAYWAAELQCGLRAERKLWEAVSVLQAFYEAGVMVPGARVLGFGVGNEALPSYLASVGLQVVATDLPGVTDPDLCWKPQFLDQEPFSAAVEVSDLDIRRLDDQTLRGFDACWSCSVLNELNSFEEAADAAILTLDTLRPGGVAVHVTEYAFANDEPEPHPGGLCFPRGFFEKLAEGLNGRGHRVAGLNFGLGAHPLDGYVDIEPFGETLTGGRMEGLGVPHLKIRSGGELRTSFIMAITARE